MVDYFANVVNLAHNLEPNRILVNKFNLFELYDKGHCNIYIHSLITSSHISYGILDVLFITNRIFFNSYIN